jgi:hypothetical protein
METDPIPIGGDRSRGSVQQVVWESAHRGWWEGEGVSGALPQTTLFVSFTRLLDIISPNSLQRSERQMSFIYDRCLPGLHSALGDRSRDHANWISVVDRPVFGIGFSAESVFEGVRFS